MLNEVTTVQQISFRILERMPAIHHKLLYLAFAAGLAVPGIAAAESVQQPGTMPVAVFLAKAEALRAKGAMALFSSDVGLLKAELNGSALGVRKQIKAQAAAGKPSACPPDRAALTLDDILMQMRSYPVDARARIPVFQAVEDLIHKRFPCPAR